MSSLVTVSGNVVPISTSLDPASSLKLILEPGKGGIDAKKQHHPNRCR